MTSCPMARVSEVADHLAVEGYEEYVESLCGLIDLCHQMVARPQIALADVATAVWFAEKVAAFEGGTVTDVFEDALSMAVKPGAGGDDRSLA